MCVNYVPGPHVITDRISRDSIIDAPMRCAVLEYLASRHAYARRISHGSRSIIGALILTDDEENRFFIRLNRKKKTGRKVARGNPDWPAPVNQPMRQVKYELYASAAALAICYIPFHIEASIVPIAPARPSCRLRSGILHCKNDLTRLLYHMGYLLVVIGSHSWRGRTNLMRGLQWPSS